MRGEGWRWRGGSERKGCRARDNGSPCWSQRAGVAGACESKGEGTPEWRERERGGSSEECYLGNREDYASLRPVLGDNKYHYRSSTRKLGTVGQTVAYENADLRIARVQEEGEDFHALNLDIFAITRMEHFETFSCPLVDKKKTTNKRKGTSLVLNIDLVHTSGKDTAHGRGKQIAAYTLQNTITLTILSISTFAKESLKPRQLWHVQILTLREIL